MRRLKYALAASAASLTLSVALAVPAAAQQTTSGIEGTVTDAGGAPLAGAQVTVTDTRTGASRTAEASADGNFRVINLVTGGPYTITADAGGYESQTTNDVFINLQGNTSLTFQLASGAGGIVITGSRAQVTQLAIGPGQSFGEETLESFPTITRDIRDFIRLDPRVSLDRSNEVDRISCLGGNDRSNGFTVDGIVQADSFGLNGTPFAARNSLPIPFDVIRETSVEFAPFNVEYGNFTGCAVNVVTKSGTNKFHGTAFFTYTGDGLQGDELDGQTLNTAPFDRYRWGATLGGPIIPDRLFFYAGYEETDLGDSQETGPTDAGFANGLDFVTTADFNRFTNILGTSYGIDTGGVARTLPQSDRRFFGRLDAYITDRQRLELTYQRLEESNTETDDFSSTNFTGFNTFEVEGTKSDYYSGRLFSDWTDSFSTEVRLSHAKVMDIQGPVGGGEAQSGNPIPRIIVGVINNGQTGTLQAGPGFSRTSNELNTEINQLKVKANYVAGNHSIGVGFEVQETRVFNLFAQNSTGTFTFNTLDDLAAGVTSAGSNTFPSAIQVSAGQAAGVYGNFTETGDINTAAARFRRTQFTGYVQDEWQATPQLNVLAGLRVDWFDGGAPGANANFANRYGYSNSVPFSVIDPAVLPRLGFTYNLDNEGFFRSTQIKGGFGIFTGGDPTVYFSNGFSNNGFNTGQGQTGVASCFPKGTNVLAGGQFTGIPACVAANGGASSARGLSDTQSTDPNFKPPTVQRANIGFATDFGAGGGFFDNFRLNVDYIYSHFKNPINFVDLSQVVNPALGLNGFTVDGRPIYRAIDPTVAGCGATLLNQGGTPPQYSNVTAACFNTGRDDEIQLTNGPSYDSHIASVILSKNFDGLFTEGGNILLNAGYAYTHADNNRYNASSTATSSYDIVAVKDRQNPAIATSEYQSAHNFSLALNLREQFFGDYDTQAGFVFIARSGRPYSPTFSGGAVFNDSASGINNALLYIPTGADDPNLAPNSNPAAVGTLLNYANQFKCTRNARGRTIERNACRNDWFLDLDLRFSQELPGPGRLLGVQDRIKVYADFDNFLNLLDSSANLFRRRDYSVPVVTTNVDNQGRYVITGANLIDNNFIQQSSSLWRIQLGVSYEF